MTQKRCMAYLGPEGTYSEEVARFLAKDEWQLQGFPSIEDAMWAVAQGEADCCVVPFENSWEGSVNVTLDLLVHELDLFIQQDVRWPIRHDLWVAQACEKPNSILSHPQALAQCRAFLGRKYPQAARIPVVSTAEAARRVAAGDGDAAIGSSLLGELYGLKLLERSIQDDEGNCTRFVLLVKKPVSCKGESVQTSLICRIDGEKPGRLYELLAEFAKREVNLTRIESRPARTKMGEYVFLMDIDGDAAQPKIAEAIQAVQKRCDWMKNLGSYAVHYEATQ